LAIEKWRFDSCHSGVRLLGNRVFKVGLSSSLPAIVFWPAKMKAMSNAISLVLKPHEMVAQQDLKDCAGMQSWDSSKGAGHIVSGQDKHLFASPGSNGRIWFGLCFKSKHLNLSCHLILLQ